jgi:protein-disulfide isomerase
MHDQLYRQQDAIGREPFSWFAAAAGAPSIDQFNACMLAPDIARQVEADAQLAGRLEARGTPTIIINGTMLGAVPDSAALGWKVDSLLALRD